MTEVKVNWNVKVLTNTIHMINNDTAHNEICIIYSNNLCMLINKKLTYIFMIS